jgi:hypothetical protein
MAPPDAQAAGASMVEPLSPMAPPDAPAAGAAVSSAAFLNGHSDFKLRSIGDNRSTNKPPSVEPLSPMAPPDAQAAGAAVFSAAFLTRPLGLQAPIDWGQSIYQ